MQLSCQTSEQYMVAALMGDMLTPALRPVAWARDHHTHVHQKHIRVYLQYTYVCGP